MARSCQYWLRLHSNRRKKGSTYARSPTRLWITAHTNGTQLDEFDQYLYTASAGTTNARGHVKAACLVYTCKYEANHSCSHDSTSETKEQKRKDNEEGKSESRTASVRSWRLDPLFSLVGAGREGNAGRGFKRERRY